MSPNMSRQQIPTSMHQLCFYNSISFVCVCVCVCVCVRVGGARHYIIMVYRVSAIQGYCHTRSVSYKGQMEAPSTYYTQWSTNWHSLGKWYHNTTIHYQTIPKPNHSHPPGATGALQQLTNGVASPTTVNQSLYRRTPISNPKSMSCQHWCSKSVPYYPNIPNTIASQPPRSWLHR